MGLIKIGCFRIVRGEEESYMSYDELLSWDEDARKRILDGVRRGDAAIYCACRADNVNSLTVTSLGYVRVASNGRQGEHADSCPKSASYAGWAASVKKGMTALEALSEDEGGRLCFNFSLPSIYPSKKSTSSSPGTGTGTPREKKIPLGELVTSVNRIAWLHQTYSIKKKIKDAKREGREPEWEYKNLEDFNRLFFGTANDVYVRVRGETVKLSSLCYRKSEFMKCADRERQFFIYAPVVRVKEFSTGRKYQYVTLAMPGTASETRATVRVATDDFPELFGNVEEYLPEGCARILAGFVRKVSFQREDGGQDDWITLVRGVVIKVTENGLFYENDEARDVIREMCRRKILFWRPYVPLENFGNEVPTILIDRFKAKTLVVDCPPSSLADAHAAYAGNNEEFDIIVARDGDPAASIVDAAVAKCFRKRKDQVN